LADENNKKKPLRNRKNVIRSLLTQWGVQKKNVAKCQKIISGKKRKKHEGRKGEKRHKFLHTTAPGPDNIKKKKKGGLRATG